MEQFNRNSQTKGVPQCKTKPHPFNPAGTLSGISDGPLHLKFELPKKVSWDQKKLGDIAAHIVASGEKVEHFLDVKLAVSESRFTNWPPTLQQEFAAARTVEPGKPSFTLSFDSEH